MKEKNIYQRLNEIMKDVSYIQKGPKSVNGQYRFASHDQVVSALRGPMIQHGVVMVPTISELTQDGNRTVAKIEISFINIDEPQDRITVTYYGYGVDQQDKGPGKAFSYGCKYALLKVFALETGDDVEKDNIDYVPEPSMKEADLKDQINELISHFPPEDMKAATDYIENWKEQLKATKKNKWVETFAQGLAKSLLSKERFSKAVKDWQSKQ